MKTAKQRYGGQSTKVTFPILFVVGMVLACSTALAQLKERGAFKVHEEVEEAVIVSEAPKKKYKIVKAVGEDATIEQHSGGPRVIFIKEAVSSSGSTQNTSLTPREKTFGQRLSERVDAKLAKVRAEKEAELARIEREQQNSILRRIDMALNGGYGDSKRPPEWIPSENVEETMVQKSSSKKDAKPKYSTLVEHEEILQARLEKRSNIRITVAPMIGISDLQGANYADYHEVESGNSFGISLDFFIRESLYSNFSYMYTEYDILGVRSSNRSRSRADLEYKQNTFSLGLKYKLFDEYFGFRPVLSTGIAYVRGYINRDEDSYYIGGAYDIEDYVVSAFTGYVGGGMEMRFSESLGVEAMFNYHTVLHNDKDNYRRPFYSTSGNSSLDRKKETIGRDIQDNAFYTISASLLLRF